MICSQAKGLKRKRCVEKNEDVQRQTKTCKMDATLEDNLTVAPNPKTIAGKDNGFHLDENNTPMFRGYDLSDLPREAHPHPNKLHTGQHGYTVVSSNYAATRSTFI